MPQTDLFPALHQRLSPHVEIIDKLGDSTLHSLVTHVCERMRDGEELTTNAEIDTLAASLNFTPLQVTSILQTLHYIVEQSAFHMANPTLVSQQSRLSPGKASVVAEVWSQYARSIVERLRQHSLQPTQLESVTWRLNLQLGGSGRYREMVPHGVLELGLTNDYLSMEFTHDQLYSFYNQLEEIQMKLDSLQ